MCRAVLSAIVELVVCAVLCVESYSGHRRRKQHESSDDEPDDESVTLIISEH